METRTLIAYEVLSILSQEHRHGHLTASPPDMASHAAAAPASLPASDALVLWLSSPDWTRPSGPSGLRQAGAAGSGGLLVPLARQQVPQAGPFVPSVLGTWLMDLNGVCQCQRCELQGAKMTRRDEHFNAMLQNLGAAYYKTIHGDATAADVARALESAEEHDGRGHEPHWSGRRHRRTGRWRVRDVMRTDVVTVGKKASYKQVVEVMAERMVNAVPVVTKDGHVAGVVSEFDLLLKEERDLRRLGAGLPARSRGERKRAEARTAAALMTSPAITIHPDAPVGVAARLMNGHHIRRLPVVDPAGELIGIVSRRDLLSVFLRPDEEIAAEVHGVLTGVLLAGPDGVEVKVTEGVVILSGTLARADLIPVAERLASDIDGVVTVVCKLTGRPATAAAGSPADA